MHVHEHEECPCIIILCGCMCCDLFKNKHINYHSSLTCREQTVTLIYHLFSALLICSSVCVEFGKTGLLDSKHATSCNSHFFLSTNLSLSYEYLVWAPYSISECLRKARWLKLLFFTLSSLLPKICNVKGKWDFIWRPFRPCTPLLLPGVSNFWRGRIKL